MLTFSEMFSINPSLFYLLSMGMEKGSPCSETAKCILPLHDSSHMLLSCETAIGASFQVNKWDRCY